MRTGLDLSKAGCRAIRKAVQAAKAAGLLKHAEPSPTRMPIAAPQDRQEGVAASVAALSQADTDGASQGVLESSTEEATGVKVTSYPAPLSAFAVGTAWLPYEILRSFTSI
jgi:hypothetical protein